MMVNRPARSAPNNGPPRKPGFADPAFSQPGGLGTGIDRSAGMRSAPSILGDPRRAGIGRAVLPWTMAPSTRASTGPAHSPCTSSLSAKAASVGTR